MNYTELSVEEKAELRERLYFESVFCRDDSTDFSYLSAEDQAIVDGCDDATDIPESVMISAYGGYAFVEEDFFCNLREYA